jgi:hypothetical protein
VDQARRALRQLRGGVGQRTRDGVDAGGQFGRGAADFLLPAGNLGHPVRQRPLAAAGLGRGVQAGQRAAHGGQVGGGVGVLELFGQRPTAGGGLPQRAGGAVHAQWLGDQGRGRVGLCQSPEVLEALVQHLGTVVMKGLAVDLPRRWLAVLTPRVAQRGAVFGFVAQHLRRQHLGIGQGALLRQVLPHPLGRQELRQLAQHGIVRPGPQQHVEFIDVAHGIAEGRRCACSAAGIGQCVGAGAAAVGLAVQPLHAVAAVGGQLQPGFEPQRDGVRVAPARAAAPRLQHLQLVDHVFAGGAVRQAALQGPAQGLDVDLGAQVGPGQRGGGRHAATAVLAVVVEATASMWPPSSTRRARSSSAPMHS